MCKYKDYLRTANNKKLVLSYLLLIMIRLWGKESYLAQQPKPNY